MKRLLVICLVISVFIAGCTIAPRKAKDTISSFDSSSPAQYAQPNAGFLGFAEDGQGLITSNARDKYNNLIKLYHNSFKKEKAVDLKEDAGITLFKDKYGNSVYKIDSEHLIDFTILNNWRKNHKPVD